MQGITVEPVATSIPASRPSIAFKAIIVTMAVVFFAMASFAYIRAEWTSTSNDIAVDVQLDSASKTLVDGGGACVMNNAWFVMRYQLKNLNTGTSSAWSNRLGAYKKSCMMADAVLQDVSPGDQIQVVSKAELGRTKYSEAIINYQPSTVSVVNYDCTGTTLYYACNLGKGDTVENITAAVEGFAEGFAEGLGNALGVQECLQDLVSSYDMTKAVASSLANGIDGMSKSSVLTAFKAAGALLESFVIAFKDCREVEQTFVGEVTNIASILTANPAEIIKTAVTGSIKIFTSASDLTADCKTMSADWINADYHGSGEALGKIIGTLITDTD